MLLIAYSDHIPFMFISITDPVQLNENSNVCISLFTFNCSFYMGQKDE